MTIAYLNKKFIPLDEARISPLDRGFLFGDGIYEMIPSYSGKLVGAKLHANRMNRGLAGVGIRVAEADADWVAIANAVLRENADQFDSANIGVYIHVSRGADVRRSHAYPKDVSPTVFAFPFEIPAPKPADRLRVKGLIVTTAQDLRWRRCHIKSTSLLGNVMHFQHSQDSGVDETLLFNEEGYLTEASISNVFVVKDGVVATPPLDNQLLPGITRHIVIESLKRDGQIDVKERSIHMRELDLADEVWITSSSKEIAAVTRVDGVDIGKGEVGEVWEQALASYHSHKFDL